MSSLPHDDGTDHRGTSAREQAEEGWTMQALLHQLLLGQPRRGGRAARAAGTAPAPGAEREEAAAPPQHAGFSSLELEEIAPKRWRLAAPLYFKVGRTPDPR